MVICHTSLGIDFVNGMGHAGRFHYPVIGNQPTNNLSILLNEENDR